MSALDSRVVEPAHGIEPVVVASGLSLESRDQTCLVDEVDLSLFPGEVIALIGESGSGKSLTVRALAGLLPRGVAISGGVIRFGGTDITRDTKERRKLIGREIGMIFQDSIGSLDPLFTLGQQLDEVLRLTGGRDRKSRQQVATALLESVGIAGPSRRLGAYPHELSGGMAQRAAIALAIANDPKVLIADESTTALDVTVQDQILGLLRDYRDERNCAIIFVSHDLATVASIADRVYVMYAGSIVESGPVDQVIQNPKHPYTVALLRSQPQLRPGTSLPASLPGGVPLAGEWPEGCRFRPRCVYSDEITECATLTPRLLPTSENRGHSCACHLVSGVGPSKPVAGGADE